MKFFISIVLIISSILTNVYATEGRNNINIVGSSTVFPFSASVAEHFGQGGKFKTPTVEATGTGGGFKIFCQGVGPAYPDIANASRKIKPGEITSCSTNGVLEIIEVKIGYDGIVFAQSVKEDPANFTRKEIYLALAKEVPDPKCAQCKKLIENPYKTWDQINPNLPSSKIQIFGPPPSSGTRDAFSELVLDSGCNEFEWLKELKKTDEKEYKRICQTIREDGAYVEAGENDNLIVQKLAINPGSFGVFGYSFLDANTDKIQASKIENITPTAEVIASGVYPVSRPLYFYVKKSQIGFIPGIKEYVKEFISEKSWSDEGYLVSKGLVPMPDLERKKVAEHVLKALK
jgi:phosphate transport system substrate-binding protein